MFFCIFLHVLKSHSLLGDVILLFLYVEKKTRRETRHSLNSNFGGYIRIYKRIRAMLSCKKKQALPESFVEFVEDEHFSDVDNRNWNEETRKKLLDLLKVYNFFFFLYVRVRFFFFVFFSKL